MVWILAFKYVPNDLDKYDLKPSFDVEVHDPIYVADFYIRLTEMIDLSDSECFAELQIKVYYWVVDENLEADDKIDNLLFLILINH